MHKLVSSLVYQFIILWDCSYNVERKVEALGVAGSSPANPTILSGIPYILLLFIIVLHKTILRYLYWITIFWGCASEGQQYTEYF
jgi:hypothetical protein